MPFDMTTTSGYFATLILQIIGGSVGMTFYIVSVAILIDITLYAVAFLSDIITFFPIIDDIVMKKIDGIEAEIEIKRNLKEFIELYSWSLE